MLSKDHQTLADSRPCCGPRTAMLRLGLLAVIAVALLVARGGEHPRAEFAGPGEGEQAGPEEHAQALAIEVSAHAYSPFLVDVHGADAFDLISFKDVGLHLDDPDSYELLAESLAMSLADHPAMTLDTHLIRDDQYTDPAYHTACGTAQIYVDVWRSSEPARWGYSLWSGCGEESQFAWEELAMTIPLEPDVALAMQPFADAIASSIGEAVESGCYERSC